MIKKLHSLIVPRVSGILRAVSRSPSAAKCFPWLLAGAVRTRTISRRNGKRLEVFLGPQRDQSVSIDLGSQQEIDVFGEVLIDRNYPLERLGFVPALIADCGANIGFFSSLARLRFPQTPISAWEPDEKNFRRASEQPILRSESVELCMAAVSDQNGFVDLTGSGHGCTVHRSDDAQVPCIDFAAWWREHSIPGSLLKMDIEGHETSVLPALKGSWKAPCAVFLETHAPRGEDGEMVKQLEADGFRVDLLRSHALPGDQRVFKEYMALLE
jgi:FkbM family methyltransferase